jgi:hypothetical protein
MIDKVLEFIDKDDLSSSNRKRSKMHKRAFLYAVLRNEGYHLKEIGKLFNRHHATVIYALKNYSNWIDVSDAMFYSDVSEYLDAFGHDKIETVKSRNLLDDVKNCIVSTHALLIIKNRIENGTY